MTSGDFFERQYKRNIEQINHTISCRTYVWCFTVKLAGPRLWSSIDIDIRSEHSIKALRKQIKSTLPYPLLDTDSVSGIASVQHDLVFVPCILFCTLWRWLDKPYQGFFYSW